MTRLKTIGPRGLGFLMPSRKGGSFLKESKDPDDALILSVYSS